jgi:hypothetical protein
MTLKYQEKLLKLEILILFEEIFENLEVKLQNQKNYQEYHIHLKNEP